MDLVIRGGNVITAESNYTADIGVRGGVIAQIGGTMDAPREIDASGKLVIPGGVDVHVHFEPDEGLGPEWEGWWTGTTRGRRGLLSGASPPSETWSRRLVTRERGMEGKG